MNSKIVFLLLLRWKMSLMLLKPHESLTSFLKLSIRKTELCLFVVIGIQTLLMILPSSFIQATTTYLEERAIFPELYSAPKGWYGTHYVARLSKELPEDTLRQMHGYYEKLLRKYPDVVTVKDVVALTGYTLTTVHNWCSRGSLKAFQKGLKFCIPKIFLVDFFCSLTFRSITRKSLWHIQTLNEFSRKMRRKK